MCTYFKRGALLALLLLSLTTMAYAVPEQPESSEPLNICAEETEAQEDQWKTMLVNPWHALPESYQTELTALKNGLQVDSRIYDDLNAMLTDCRIQGMEPIVCSAYRTHAVQKRLYQNKVARLLGAGYKLEAARIEAARWVAVPGTSEHETGLALDIVSKSYQLLEEAQENTVEQQWLMENCWKYGFILRYPKDKTEITGIGYEPWHYRYVGKEAAAVMQDSGFCLEEYLEHCAEEESTESTFLFLQNPT